MAGVDDIFRDWPRIGCCGATCGDSCACCCDNVQYASLVTFDLHWTWQNTPGQETCTDGAADLSIPLTSNYADFHDPPGEFGDIVNHPCSYIWSPGTPTDLGTVSCGDLSFIGNCRPGGEFGDFCFDAPFYLRGAFFSCNCKVGPQPIGGPYSGMPQVGDGTMEAAKCTVASNDVGSSKAGWVGGLSFTTNPDCTDVAPGGGGCMINFQINQKGHGTGPGDLTEFMTFGLCSSVGTGCPAWRCCDPFHMRFYYGVRGGWVTVDPMDASIWPLGADTDHINCNTDIAHQGGVDYPLSSYPYVDVSADHTCVPSGPLAAVARMSDAEVHDSLTKLIAEMSA